MNSLSTWDLDDDFYLRFNTPFIKKYIKETIRTSGSITELSDILQTPTSNILRMKNNGIIRKEHLGKMNNLIPISNKKIIRNF